jgi:2-phosphosulfolactate phosphatase
MENFERMEFRRASLDTCATATGAVVVIDVLRAFSTAAYAFAAGVKDITLVSSIEESFELKKQIPDILLMGEMGSLPVKGFDFSNSPTSFDHRDLAGRRMVQRTTAGTQGVIRSQKADHLLASSFCCASATAHHLSKLAPATVTFVITGIGMDGGIGDEDAACADYLEALVKGKEPDPAPFIQRVVDSITGRFIASSTLPDLPAADLDLCVQVNRFDFAMVIERQNGLPVMHTVREE